MAGTVTLALAAFALALLLVVSLFLQPTPGTGGGVRGEGGDGSQRAGLGDGELGLGGGPGGEGGHISCTGLEFLFGALALAGLGPGIGLRIAMRRKRFTAIPAGPGMPPLTDLRATWAAVLIALGAVSLAILLVIAVLCHVRLNCTRLEWGLGLLALAFLAGGGAFLWAGRTGTTLHAPAATASGSRPGAGKRMAGAILLSVGGFFALAFVVVWAVCNAEPAEPQEPPERKEVRLRVTCWGLEVTFGTAFALLGAAAIACFVMASRRPRQRGWKTAAWIFLALSLLMLVLWLLVLWVCSGGMSSSGGGGDPGGGSDGTGEEVVPQRPQIQLPWLWILVALGVAAVALATWLWLKSRRGGGFDAGATGPAASASAAAARAGQAAPPALPAWAQDPASASRDQVIARYRSFLAWCEARGLGRAATETAREHASRVAAAAAIPDPPLAALANAYAVARLAHEPPGPAEDEAARRALGLLPQEEAKGP